MYIYIYIYTHDIIYEYDNNDNLVILIMMIMIAVISILCMYKYIHSIFKIVETRKTWYWFKVDCDSQLYMASSSQHWDAPIVSVVNPEDELIRRLTSCRSVLERLIWLVFHIYVIFYPRYIVSNIVEGKHVSLYQSDPWMVGSRIREYQHVPKWSLWKPELWQRRIMELLCRYICPSISSTLKWCFIRGW